jgi:hypothetical protein
LADRLGAHVELEGDWLQERDGALPRTAARSDDAPGTAASSGPGAPVQLLFGEGPGGFVASGEEAALTALAERTSVRLIGTVGGDSLSIGVGCERLEASLPELECAHAALEELFA